MPGKRKRGPDVVDQLKQHIRNSGQSLYRLAQTTGVDAARLSRFMRGERGLSLQAFNKICETLELDLEKRGEGKEEE